VSCVGRTFPKRASAARVTYPSHNGGRTSYRVDHAPMCLVTIGGYSDSTRRLGDIVTRNRHSRTNSHDFTKIKAMPPSRSFSRGETSHIPRVMRRGIYQRSIWSNDLGS
jgi:hypothetical protein